MKRKQISVVREKAMRERAIRDEAIRKKTMHNNANVVSSFLAFSNSDHYLDIVEYGGEYFFRYLPWCLIAGPFLGRRFGRNMNNDNHINGVNSGADNKGFATPQVAYKAGRRYLKHSLEYDNHWNYRFILPEQYPESG